VDADDEYRLADPDPEPYGVRRHREYLDAAPDGWFTAIDLGRIMGVTRQSTSRHLAMLAKEGKLERVGSRYRRVAP
jgi:Fic family protein